MQRGIWQRRYCENLIMDEEDVIRHIEYIHYKAAKLCYVLKPIDWPFSSIHRDIHAGIVSPNWGNYILHFLINLDKKSWSSQAHSNLRALQPATRAQKRLPQN